MARALLTNNASSTLLTGINSVVTSLSVASGSGALFPAPGANYFYCTLAEGALVEIVKVTDRTTDTFTIVRAQDGTTAQAFTTAATVKLNLTAAVMAELQDMASKDTSEGYAGLTLFKLNLRNAANTITSWFTTAATVARTWTMPDKDGTVAMTSDLTAASVANTPAGGIAAITVQAAINELDTEKAKVGANSDITSLAGLTTALSIAQGGTGAATANAAADALGAFRKATILGTVSQSAGVPTGAIIEHGSNANGEYVRWADGTQICWGTYLINTTTAAGNGIFIGLTGPVASPAVFIGAPVVNGHAIFYTGAGLSGNRLYGLTFAITSGSNLFVANMGQDPSVVNPNFPYGSGTAFSCEVTRTICGRWF